MLLVVLLSGPLKYKFETSGETMRATVAFLTLFLVFTVARSATAQEVILPPDVVKKQAAVPETVLYAVLLHQVAAFKDKADELDRQGKDGSPYRHHIASTLGLSAQQMLYIDSVALQYREESKGTEAEIAESVQRFHDQNKSLAEGQHATLPPEAKYLLHMREEGIKRARDQFHSLVGDNEFVRIDGMVKSRYRAGFQRAASTQQPASTTPIDGGLGK